MACLHANDADTEDDGHKGNDRQENGVVLFLLFFMQRVEGHIS